MRVLFSMLHPGHVREHEGVIRLLAERDHQVHLIFHAFREREGEAPIDDLTGANANVSHTAGVVPTRADRWSSMAKMLRGAGAGAAAGGSWSSRAVRRCLHAAELALPPDPRIAAFLRSLDPHVVLVTPLVDTSEQKDYVRAAQAAGYPVGLCVASQDDLSDRGLVAPSPDLVVLSNESQRAVQAIEELAGISPSPAAGGWWTLVLRRALLGPALLLWWLDREESDRRQEARTFLRRAVRAAGRRVGLRVGKAAHAGGKPAPEGPSRPREVRLAIRRLARSKSPIVVGPWLSEVGFEVLYWIPFLNWARRHAALDPARVVVVAHGGTRSWYGDLGARYLDVLDLFTVEEFRTLNERRVELAGGRKHRRITELDEEVLKRVRKALGVPEVEVLHPSLMYNLFVPFWSSKGRPDLIDKYSERSLFPPPPSVPGLTLPAAGYTAVKFYWSACFPPSAENRAFVTRTVRALAAQSDVVLLDTGLILDDHRECECPFGERIHRIAGRVVPSRNLEVQSRIVAGARAFVGTYGGFSYLAPSYGVPALAIYSQADGFLPIHLRVAERAYGNPPFGAFRIADAADVGDVSWLWRPNGLLAAAG